MKTIKLILGVLFILFLQSCNKKEDGFKKLVGEWSNWLTFQQQDTVVLGILTSDKTVNISSKEIVYTKGSVLFKDIKRLSDTSFLAKGLYIKPIFRTEEVIRVGISGRYYDKEQIFDHYENNYVDYRLELKLNKTPVEYYSLYTIPFSEGEQWTENTSKYYLFQLKNKNEKNEKIINDVIKIYNDSVTVGDSLAMAKALDEYYRTHGHY